VFQEQVGLLKADVVRIQQQVEAAINCGGGGGGGSVASCLQDVASLSGDLQQRIHVFLVDFDLQFFLASKEKQLAVSSSGRLTADRRRNDRSTDVSR